MNYQKLKALIELLNGLTLKEVVELFSYAAIAISTSVIDIENDHNVLSSTIEYEKQHGPNLATAFIKQALISLSWLEIKEEKNEKVFRNISDL